MCAYRELNPAHREIRNTKVVVRAVVLSDQYIGESSYLS
jgi:hypothetical protein